jgi:glycosyltransferase involved in cell wall biosynthesis
MITRLRAAAHWRLARAYRVLRQHTPDPVWRLLWAVRQRLRRVSNVRMREEGTARAHAPLPSRVARAVNGARRVCILTPAFFDADGRVPFFGGAERYLHELVHLLRSMGYEPEIYQPASRDWIRPFRDLEIIGLDTGGDPELIHTVFHTRVPKPDLTIYLAFYLAGVRHFSPSIGVSHGVYWDHEFFHETPAHLQRTLRSVLSGLEHVTTVVSVDTNTINWLRTMRRSLAQKCTYIPNFVDFSQFGPRPAHVHRNPGEVVILFPRRLYDPRGFSLLMEVIPSILNAYPQAVFYLVGQSNSDAERSAVERTMAEYPRRVRWDVFPPERMHEAYWAADITVIPTVSSEGTSLSCLEAMASGSAVIATDVGGLPNLILHRHNGLLIKPAVAELREALETLLDDAQLRATYARRALESAQAFGIDRWRDDWRRMLERYLPPQPASVVRRTMRPARTFVVENPSLAWDRMKQRPQYLAEEVARAGWRVYWRQPEREAASLADVQVVSQTDHLYVERPYVYVFYPYDYEHLAAWRDPFVIYDVLDHISTHDESDRLAGQPRGRRAREYAEKLLREADVVTTSSRSLFDEVRQVRADAMYVPNGVDLDRFDVRRVFPEPPDLAKIGRPRIAFHGAIASWIDIELIAAVARACPRYEFVFIGPVSVDVTPLALRNCHVLGERPPESIPAYLAAMDVCVAPFVMNTISRYVRPLKVLEALAMRKPVVATELPDVEDWPYVARASGVEGFRNAIDEALHAADTMRNDAGLSEFLEANSWQNAVRPLLRRVYRLSLRERSGRREARLIRAV